MKQNGFIKNFVIIGIILAVLVLSQREHLFGKGKTFTFVNGAVEQAEEYITQGTGWFMSKAFPSISGEVQKRGDMVKEGVSEQKEKITESATEKIKNYFSGITDAVIHPGNSSNNQNPENNSDSCVCP